MENNLKVYYYNDGSKESKKLIFNGDAKGFVAENKEVIKLELGENFTIAKEDGTDILVRVFSLVTGLDGNAKEYHIAPSTVSSYQFNK